jgi:hypothetical protein
VFRDLLLEWPTGSSSNTSGNEKRNENDKIIHLDGVTAFEFQSLLSFFYEGYGNVHCTCSILRVINQISDVFLSSWLDSFVMSTEEWVALLSITHRFRFIEAKFRAQREIFEHSIALGPVARISLAEKHSVPTTFIVPALEDLVRRPEPLLERDIANLSGEMVARLGDAREKYLRESSRMFASETWLKRVAHDIVKQLWRPTREGLNWESD